MAADRTSVAAASALISTKAVATDAHVSCRLLASDVHSGLLASVPSATTKARSRSALSISMSTPGDKRQIAKFKIARHRRPRSSTLALSAPLAVGSPRTPLLTPAAPHVDASLAALQRAAATNAAAAAAAVAAQLHLPVSIAHHSSPVSHSLHAAPHVSRGIAAEHAAALITRGVSGLHTSPQLTRGRPVAHTSPQLTRGLPVSPPQLTRGMPVAHASSQITRNLANTHAAQAAHALLRAVPRTSSPALATQQLSPLELGQLLDNALIPSSPRTPPPMRRTAPTRGATTPVRTPRAASSSSSPSRRATSPSACTGGSKALTVARMEQELAERTYLESHAAELRGTEGERRRARRTARELGRDAYVHALERTVITSEAEKATLKAILESHQLSRSSVARALELARTGR